MTFKAGESGNPEGRKKGSKNQFTTLKEKFLNVVERLGGEDALYTFAKENPKDFWKMIQVMLPRNVIEQIAGELLIKWDDGEKAKNQLPEGESNASK